MLDLDFIRKNPERVRINAKNRGANIDFDKFLNLDATLIKTLRELEDLRAQRNRLSEQIATASSDERPALIERAGALKLQIKSLEEKYRESEAAHRDLWLRIPNMVSEKMPVGTEESDNEVLKVWLPAKGYLEGPFDYDDVSYMPVFDFETKDHITLGEMLDVIDVKQSAIVSGSRFSYLKNEAVLLQEAVFNLLRQELLRRGFMPIMPPLLVRERSLVGTSHFPEGRDQVYRIDNFNVEDSNNLFLVGSSEPANFSYFMDKVLDADSLPIKVYAATTCFRSEVGSWGKDVRGIKRVHQFDKLEMNCVCRPDQSWDVFREFQEINEWLMQQLRLPYRVINKCTADAGYNASHYQNDVDYWRPPVREFMEFGTNTITTDYQARRLNIRFREDGQARYVHTVNDTGVTTRVVIAILENYQQADGSVVIPEVLRPFMGGMSRIDVKNR